MFYIDYYRAIGKIKDARKNPEKYGLEYKKYGEFDDIQKYSDEELYLMLIGAYVKSGFLRVDGNYFINVKDVIGTGCTLFDIELNKKKLSVPYIIIKNFYLKDYYLITKDSINGNTKHTINSFLAGTKVIRQNKSPEKLYKLINNDNFYRYFSNGRYPKMLFHPIKAYFNRIFWDNDYKISDFAVNNPNNIKLDYPI